MCMKQKKIPPAVPPAPAPAPPQPAAEVMQAESDDQDSVVERANRRGRAALRIDPNGVGGVGGPVGVNVPRG